MQIPFYVSCFTTLTTVEITCAPNPTWTDLVPNPCLRDSPPEQLHTLHLFFRTRATPEELSDVCHVVMCRNYSTDRHYASQKHRKVIDCPTWQRVVRLIWHTGVLFINTTTDNENAQYAHRDPWACLFVQWKRLEEHCVMWMQMVCSKTNCVRWRPGPAIA